MARRPARSTPPSRATSAPAAVAPALRNIETITQLEAEAQANLNALERVSQRIADFASSPRFIALHVAWFAGWIAVNSLMATPVDPYPFTFLTFLVSLEAIFLTSFVLISQQQLEQLSHRRAALDLQINLLAEAEMTKMFATITAIAKHLGLEEVCDDPEVQALAAETDIAALATAVAEAGEAAKAT